MLAVISVIFSRLFFTLLDDPEGPNLLIVSVLAALLYGLTHFLNFLFQIPRPYRLWVALAFQGITIFLLSLVLR